MFSFEYWYVLLFKKARIKMLFNSYEFIFYFFPICILGYFLLNKISYALGEYLLIIMSFYFYAYFNPSYFPIILGSILGNYALTYIMRRQEKPICKKIFLVIGVIANVGILFYYKYMGFFIHNVNVIFGTDFFVTNILLPLGISFFTFQQLSYVIDSYTGTVPQYTFRQYALFVTFFPQLIAGPIVLHSEVIPQFEDKAKKVFNWDNFAAGLMAFSFGMAKKVLVADSFGNVVNWGFSNVNVLGTTNAIFVMLSYTMQIYFDFSGYCDMATGIAKIFNIEIPMNFNSPYTALSVTEFWKRWHMTLTRFLRTYIYFPLGGNRKGKIRTYVNLFTVFLVSGIWHGANYTFIVWGVMHGLVMIGERIFKEKVERIHPALRWAYTFIFVSVAWVIFRADSLEVAVTLLKQILDFNFTSLSGAISPAFGCVLIQKVLGYMGTLGVYFQSTLPVYLMLAALFAVLWCKNTNERLDQFKSSKLNAIISAILLVLSIISLSGESTFLYFNF